MEDFEDELIELGEEGDLLEIRSLGLWTSFGPDGHPILTKEILEHALLSENYFPRLKARKTELPSLFSSADFTPQVASEVRNKDSLDSARKSIGFSSVQYTQTRHEGTGRVTHIPHPYAHCAVVDSLMEGWDELQALSLNTNSAIRPMVFRDGRVFASNYSSITIEERDWDRLSEFGTTIRAFFDIKEFFPSIYTHSVPWIAFGKEFVQTNLRDKTIEKHFTNKLDFSLRQSNRRQTKGILIGPSTSNLVAEYLLHPIDLVLRKKFGDRFRRHIDDYRFYAINQHEVDEFRVLLEKELAKFELTLNPHKLRQEPVSEPVDPSWKVKLVDLAAQGLDSPEKIEGFWGEVVSEANEPNSGMALRYGMRLIISHARGIGQSPWAAIFLIREIRRFPYLSPLLDEFTGEIQDIPNSDLKYLRDSLKSKFEVWYSDSRSWITFFLGLASEIDDELAAMIIASDDVVTMTTLLWSRPETAQNIAASLKEKLSGVYGLDERWLLAYQLYLKNYWPCDSDGVFLKLKRNGVDFIDASWRDYFKNF